MSAAAVRLSRNRRMAISGFHPRTIVATQPWPLLRGRRRAGGRFLLPLAALHQPGRWVSLRRECTREAHAPVGGAARAGLPDAGVPIAARPPGVREILEA